MKEKILDCYKVLLAARTKCDWFNHLGLCDTIGLIFSTPCARAITRDLFEHRPINTEIHHFWWNRNDDGNKERIKFLENRISQLEDEINEIEKRKNT
jgi:hypothetical protein